MRGQVSAEYIVIVGFVSAAVMGVLLIAYLYSGTAADSIISNQLEIFVSKIVQSSENVYYAGEPSQATITIYVPKQVTDIIIPSAPLCSNEIIVKSTSHNGENIRSFTSTVCLAFDPSLDKSRLIGEGTKRLKLVASTNKITISMM